MPYRESFAIAVRCTTNEVQAIILVFCHALSTVKFVVIDHFKIFINCHGVLEHVLVYRVYY